MVLYDVAQAAHRLVERPAPLHAERLGHLDVHAPDVAAVPDGLEDRVAEARDQDVLHLLVAQEVVDAEDLVLAQHRCERVVEFLGRSEVAAQGLFHHHAGVLGEVVVRQRGNHLAEQPRGDGQVEHRQTHVLHGIGEVGERGRIVVVAVHVLDAVQQLLGRLVLGGHAGVGERRADAVTQLLEAPPLAGDADDRDVELAALLQGVQRRVQLLVRQVAGCAEQDQAVGLGAHAPPSTWPPKPRRMAESTLLA